MGKEVRAGPSAFVSFKPNNGSFTAFVTVDALLSNEEDVEVVLKKAVKSYERSIARMRSIVAEIRAARVGKQLIPARWVWRLGDAIFDLKDQLEELSLQVDDLYHHLVRDLGVKRKWLEKVVILRRHLPKETLIPESLNWGRCEKGTRRVAEKLRRGQPLA